MLKRLLRYILPVLLSAGLAACTPGAEDPVVGSDPSIVPKKTRVNSIDVSVFVEITAPGAWTVELEYPAEGPSGWAWMDPASGTGDLGNARLRFSENTSEEYRSVTLNLMVKGKTAASATVEQLGTSGAHSTGGREGIVQAGWMELPSTYEDDGRVFLAHDMKGNEYRGSRISGMRNWSCYWDYEEHMSVWVAYPLNHALKGNGNFGYSWGVMDPLLPSSKQPDLSGGSYGGSAWGGGNWNRGHQLPRADRQTSQDAVNSTCFPTNITPQDGSFNSGIWVKLENQVREYASNSDTSYVVTGCIWKDSQTFTRNYTGWAVRVPDHYFKAILYYGPHSQAAATKRYMAAAFYLPHDTNISGKNFRDYIMTVDQLEELTGIDFFVNLPAAVGKETADKIESEVLSFWK
jgi:DNA/RNA endonuclease G (NUC1)